MPLDLPRGCIRIKKLKDRGAVIAAFEHNQRLTLVPHAKTNPTRPNTNVGVKSSTEFLELVTATRGRQPNGRETYAYEVVGSVPLSPPQRTPEMVALLEKLVPDFLAKSLPTPPKAISFHYDESEWHFHSIHDSACEKTKRCVIGKFTNRPNLQQLQSDYATHLGVPMGFSRGIPDSKVTHVQVRTHYRAVKAGTAVPDIRVHAREIPPRKLLESFDDYAERVAQQINQRQAPKLETISHKAAAQWTAARKAEELTEALALKDHNLEIYKERYAGERDAHQRTKAETAERIKMFEAQVLQQTQTVQRLETEKARLVTALTKATNPALLGEREILKLAGFAPGQLPRSWPRPGRPLRSIDFLVQELQCSVGDAHDMVKKAHGDIVARQEVTAALAANPRLLATKTRITLPPAAPAQEQEVTLQSLAKLAGVDYKAVDFLARTGKLYADTRGRGIFLLTDKNGNVGGWTAFDPASRRCGPTYRSSPDVFCSAKAGDRLAVAVAADPIAFLQSCATDSHSEVFLVNLQAEPFTSKRLVEEIESAPCVIAANGTNRTGPELLEPVVNHFNLQKPGASWALRAHAAAQQTKLRVQNDLADSSGVYVPTPFDLD